MASRFINRHTIHVVIHSSSRGVNLYRQAFCQADARIRTAYPFITRGARVGAQGDGRGQLSDRQRLLGAGFPSVPQRYSPKLTNRKPVTHFPHSATMHSRGASGSPGFPLLDRSCAGLSGRDALGEEQRDDREDGELWPPVLLMAHRISAPALPARATDGPTPR
jgi:hypothetical protein